MIALVTGGASSGKSAFAERLALSLPAPHVYAATMRQGDAETAQRIARHRWARAGKGFLTVELAEGDALAPGGGTVLLEDLGNLAANDLTAVLPTLLEYDNVVVVANEVGCDGVRYDGFTQDYIQRLGELSCQVAVRAAVVVEVVAGIPNVVKGEVSWMR